MVLRSAARFKAGSSARMVAKAPHVFTSKVRVKVARSMAERDSKAGTECVGWGVGTRPRRPAEWRT